MQDFKVAESLLSPGCFMATVDLKDAYLLVSIYKGHRNFLRFSFKGIIYKFTARPFGLASAPYAFTKLMKPVVSTL